MLIYQLYKAEKLPVRLFVTLKTQSYMHGLMLDVLAQGECYVFKYLKVHFQKFLRADINARQAPMLTKIAINTDTFCVVGNAIDFDT